MDDLAWRRSEPYRKIIETLESRVAELETVRAEDVGLRDSLQDARGRNSEFAQLFEKTSVKTAEEIATLRKEFEGAVRENGNLLKQLQVATNSVYETREGNEELVKQVQTQKAKILTLEGKLKVGVVVFVEIPHGGDQFFLPKKDLIQVKVSDSGESLPPTSIRRRSRMRSAASGKSTRSNSSIRSSGTTRKLRPSSPTCCLR